MKLNNERLKQAIRAFVDVEMEYSETASVYEKLNSDFGLTDDEIKELGFDYLIPESNKTNEEPLTSYDIRYRELWAGRYTIKAHSKEEAERIFQEKFESGEIDLVRMEKVNSDWVIFD